MKVIHNGGVVSVETDRYFKKYRIYEMGGYFYAEKRVFLFFWKRLEHFEAQSKWIGDRYYTRRDAIDRIAKDKEPKKEYDPHKKIDIQYFN